MGNVKKDPNYSQYSRRPALLSHCRNHWEETSESSGTSEMNQCMLSAVCKGYALQRWQPLHCRTTTCTGKPTLANF